MQFVWYIYICDETNSNSNHFEVVGEQGLGVRLNNLI